MCFNGRFLTKYSFIFNRNMFLYRLQPYRLCSIVSKSILDPQYQGPCVDHYSKNLRPRVNCVTINYRKSAHFRVY